MAVGDYAKTEYVNGGAPGISAERLNNNENKTAELDTAFSEHGAWENILADNGTTIINGTLTLDVDSAQVDLTIPAGYRYLMLKMLISGTTSAVYVLLRFNDDSTANHYTTERASAVNTLVGCSSYQSDSFLINASNAVVYTGYPLAGTIQITNKSTYNKPILTDYMVLGSPGTGIRGFGSGFWVNATDEINKISCFLSAGNIASGSMLTLWGAK